jgi:hypothetical protein
MIMTCEATGMTLAYFTTSAREDENLPIIKDAINWLHLRYNLKVSVVKLDDEMVRNKTKAWLINRSISFERCAPDVCPTPCGETLWQRRHTSTTEHLTTLWGGRAHMKRSANMLWLLEG